MFPRFFCACTMLPYNIVLQIVVIINRPPDILNSVKYLVPL